MSASTLKGPHLLTLAAVVFAGYALYETFKTSSSVAPTQANQAAQNTGLAAFTNLLTSQATNLASNLSFDQNLQAQATNIMANTESTAPNF